MSTEVAVIVQVALPRPWYRLFDYIPGEHACETFQPGVRVKVPLGHAQVIGLCMGCVHTSSVPADQLKPVIEVLDTQPLLDEPLLALARWAAEYYQHPLGEVLSQFLPAMLRKGASLEALQALDRCVQRIDTVKQPKSAVQKACLEYLDQRASTTVFELEASGFSKRTISALHDKGYIRYGDIGAIEPLQCGPGLALNAAQQAALDAIRRSDGFQAFLLHGVTGSGKTEVYLQAVACCVNAGQQALVLVPEISLTPQTLARFESRFSSSVGISHSGMDDRARAKIWADARSGRAQIVIGTRSALLMPFKNLGLMVIDESHDGSYKQQSGFQYQARDLAIVRARNLDIPIVLGSATPSMESVYAADQGRYHLLSLPERAGGAQLPALRLHDIRDQTVRFGLSKVIKEMIVERLAADQQVLLFLNRRGYAPTLYCHQCGWRAICEACDVGLTWHRRADRLRCHHCDFNVALPAHCPACEAGKEALVGLGVGTQKLEEELPKLFPQVPIYRLDRDSLALKGALESQLEVIQRGDPGILVGTQILAKGHHFPKVSLVVVVDADAALYSQDFREPEHLAQLLMQVAGRAGRDDIPGEVWVQTRQPSHPLLQALVLGGYPEFTQQVLTSRKRANLPPFARLAKLSAESGRESVAIQFLRAVAVQLRAMNTQHASNVKVLGPMSSAMPKRAGRYRVELVLHSLERLAIQKLLSACTRWIETAATKQRIRWSINIDL